MAKKGTVVLAVVCAGIVIGSGIGAVALIRGGAGSKIGSAIQASVVTPSPAPTIPVITESFALATATPDTESALKLQALTILGRGTMLPGMSIGGIDVGGLTVQEAREKLNKEICSGEREPEITLLVNGQAYVPPADDEEDEEVSEDFKDEQDEPVRIIIQPEIERALEQADTLLRESDDTMAVINEAEDIARNGRDIPISYTMDVDDARLYIASVAQNVDSPATNASFQANGKNVEVVDEAPGYGIDQEALLTRLMSLDFSKPQQIEVPMTELQPSVTREMLETQYTRRGKYTTSFSGSTKNRKYNIQKGCDLINGTVLHPGDVFSTNATLGVRTKKNGWKTAGAYEAGQVVQQAGGGVCQLSGTLYNAVLYANLEIVERRNHSMPVHYLDKGRDATINSVGNIIDFKFKNNTSQDIIIIGYTDGNNLTFEIYGEDRGYDNIEITTKKRHTEKYKTIYTDDPTLEEGKEVTDVSGVTGYTVETFVTYYNNGKVDHQVSLGNSVYKAFNAQVRRGTKPVEKKEETKKEDDEPYVEPVAEPKNDPKDDDIVVEKKNDGDKYVEPTAKPKDPEPEPEPVKEEKKEDTEKGDDTPPD